MRWPVALAAAMVPGAALAQTMPVMDMSASAPPAPPPGETSRTGDAPPPAPPSGYYADRRFPAEAMAAARARMMHDEGGQLFYQVMANLAEVQVRHGEEGYRWDGEAWIGGDVDRAVLRSEGSGRFRRGVDEADVQALYSHAIGPYFDLQGGIRHDVAPTPTRTYATIGVEGLAPYLFQVEARGFVATTGQVLGRLEAWYDQRLTQRLTLQPRVELNLAAQDDAPTRTGAGLVDAELGLRLRYAIARAFAPYVGVSYEAKFGRTAGFARADGDRPAGAALVAGVRFWF